MLSFMYVECHKCAPYAESLLQNVIIHSVIVVNVIMLSVIMLNIVMLSIIKFSAIMLNVVGHFFVKKFVNLCFVVAENDTFKAFA